jgi:hypothetical protein
MRSIASRSHRRMSVATWSLRLRPVCRRLPASPTSAVRRFSMFRCTSSSSRFQANSPRSISPAICAMPRSISTRSCAPMMPWRASIFACASEPRISWAAMRWSKSTLAV